MNQITKQTKAVWDHELVLNSEGMNEMGYTTLFQAVDIEVYPVKDGGWEYRLKGNVGDLGKSYHGEYDSLIESYNGKEHANSEKQAKEWAIQTVKDFIEENNDRRWKNS